MLSLNSELESLLTSCIPGAWPPLLLYHTAEWDARWAYREAIYSKAVFLCQQCVCPTFTPCFCTDTTPIGAFKIYEGKIITMFRRQLWPYRLKLSMMPIQGLSKSHMMARLGCSPVKHSTLKSRQLHFPMLTPRIWHKVGALSHLWEGSTTSKVGTWSSGPLGLSSTFHLAPLSLFHHHFLCTQILPFKKRSSIVQYAACGLFRWVNRGFQSDKN